MSYIRLCNYVMLNPKEPTKSVLNGTFLIEKSLNTSFSESRKKSFDKVRNA